MTGESSFLFFIFLDFFEYFNQFMIRSGFVAIFGDSSCLEVGTTSDAKSCVFLLEALLESALEGDLIESLRQSLVPVSIFLDIFDLCSIISSSILQ